MISPCIKNCKIDNKTKICIGCKRTLDEIATWTTYSTTQQQKIIDSLKYR